MTTCVVASRRCGGWVVLRYRDKNDASKLVNHTRSPLQVVAGLCRWDEVVKYRTSNPQAPHSALYSDTSCGPQDWKWTKSQRIPLIIRCRNVTLAVLALLRQDRVTIVVTNADTRPVHRHIGQINCAVCMVGRIYRISERK